MRVRTPPPVTSVMSFGGNRALSIESSIRADDMYNNQRFETFWLTKDGFLGGK